MEKPRILVIEDNDDDILMIKRGFKKGKIGNNFNRVINGKEAIAYLESNDSEKVELILLDLNMEIMNGFEFLKYRQNCKRIRDIPVVVLTSSNRQDDIRLAYNLGANSYVEKPIDPHQFIETLLSIEDFWVFIAKKPFFENTMSSAVIF